MFKGDATVDANGKRTLIPKSKDETCWIREAIKKPATESDMTGFD